MPFFWNKANIFRVARGSIVAVICWAALPLLALAQSASTSDQTEAHIANAMLGLQRFQSSHSLDDLRATSRGLLSSFIVPRIKPGDLIARRRSLITGFGEVLHQVDLLSDPTFDPNSPENTPQICLTPPQEPSGRQLASCADPNDISDPATRAQYIAAIDKNNLKIQRRNQYTSLRALDDEVMSEVQITLRLFHAKTTGDTPALDNILRHAGISDVRRAKIDAMI